MIHTDNSLQVDIALVRYLDALDDKDFDTIETIWKQAESDPTLVAALIELNTQLVLDKSEPTAPTNIPPEPSPLPVHPVAPSLQNIVDAIYTGYRCRVLVVDDEPSLLDILRRNLAPEFEVLVAHSLESAKDIFLRQSVDILLTDLGLRGPKSRDQDGIELMEWARERSPRTVSLLMSGYGEMDSVIEAINRGQVFNYLPKTAPFPMTMLLETTRRASHAFTLERKNQELLVHLKDMNMELEEKVRLRTGELREAMQELALQNKMLEKLALTDALTGLPNRRAMDRLAERDLLWRNRNPAPLAIGLVDIDLFKNVNTEYEWSGGDRVLTEVSRILSDSLREIDQIGRYGGEEFMLIAPQADRHGAEILAERIRKRVESTPIHYKGHTIHVTVSIGLAVVEKDGSADLDRMKGACEAALKRAKAEGRNRCVITTIPVDEARLAQRSRG